MEFGTDTYRRGAEARIESARILLQKRDCSGSIYMAGLAVECAMRSLIWLRDNQFDARHDLRKMAVRIENLGLIRKGVRDNAFVVDAQAIARSWLNNLRFADDSQVQKWLRAIGVLKKNDRTGLWKATDDHFSRCHRFIKRCNLIWERQKSPRRN